MIDTRELGSALAQARAARQEAEDACCDLEELLWEVERGPRIWRRLAQVDAPGPGVLAVASGVPAPWPLAA